MSHLLKTIALAALCATVPLQAQEGRTLLVGPGKEFERIADAAAAVRPGDTVLIDPGVYNEAVRWRAGDLNGPPITVRGAGVDATVVDGKGLRITGGGQVPRALFQIEGDNYVIEDITFRNGSNDHNGAGIRVLNSRLTTVRRSRIIHNDMGVMSSDNGELIMEHCEVAYNGTPRFNGYSHNFYLQGEKVTVRHSYIHDSTAGENFKSYTRYVELFHNVIVDAHDRFAGGERTKEMGIQDGETTARPHSNAVLVGNLIVKRGDGSGFIDFGSEGAGVRNGTLYMLHNTVIREAGSNWWFLRVDGPEVTAVLRNNIFYGGSQALARGAGAARITGSHNWFPHGTVLPEGVTDSVFGSDPGFVSLARRDYRLRAGAEAADRGVTDLSYVDNNGETRTLATLHEALPDMAVVERSLTNGPDLGAFEQTTAEAEGSAQQAVRGRVVDGQGRPLERVLVLLRGPRNASMITDAEGRYQFEQLPEGTYTVSPVDFTLPYTPTRRELASLAEAGEVEFAAPRLHTISGRTTALDGRPIPETVLTLDGPQLGWASTDNDGRYAFTRVIEGNSLRVVSFRYNRVYNPGAQAVEAIAGDTVLDFAGRGMFTISGRVTDAQGNPLAGVPIALRGEESRTTTTNERGNYTFGGVPEDGSYTIAAVQEGLTFTPAEVPVERLTGNFGANFFGPGALRIAGRATDTAGNGLANVTIALTGTVARRITTAADGTYSLIGLLPAGTYTVTASRSGFVFPDGPQTLAGLAEDGTVNFRALTVFTLRGQVANAAGQPMSSVGISVTGAVTRNISTNAQGAFALTNVVEGSTITVRAARNGFVFTPESRTFEAIPVGQTADFTGQALVTVSGRVVDANNRGVGGLTVTLSGAASRTTTTNSGGTYSFTGLLPGQSYTVTPSRTNWVFAPESQTLENVGANVTADFAGRAQ